MRANLLLGAAAVGVLVTGAIAQTTSNIERIKDPAGHQTPARDGEPKKNVRTVYPNTQNAEQAAREAKSAQGQADASKRQPGDVTPQPAANAQPSAPASTQQLPAAQSTSTQPASAPPPATQQPEPTVTAAQPSAPPQPAAAQSNRAGSSSVIALDTQQQTSIGQALAQRGVKPLTDVSFSIAVGTKVPAAVQLRALPADFAIVVPQYRGYSYVVVEEQIVIVDPGTHEIVAIVPYIAAAAAPTRTVETSKARTPVAEKPMVNRSVNLNTEEKAVSRRPATERKKATRSVVKREYREERAPRAVTVEESAPIRGPVIREHRFVDDDDEVIVAPRQNGFFGFFR